MTQPSESPIPHGPLDPQWGPSGDRNPVRQSVARLVWPFLVRHLRPRVGADEAEDIAQDVVMELMSRLDSGTLDFSSEPALMKWSAQRARMRLLDRARGRRARRDADAEYGRQHEDIGGAWGDPFTETTRREFERAVHEALDHLPAAQRRVAVSRLAGASIDEVAAELGIRPQTAKNASSAAWRVLGRRLEPFFAEARARQERRA